MTESKPEYFYKYVTAETAIAILYNGSVRFSSPRLFNDPFDVQLRPRFPGTKKQFRKAMEARILDIIAAERGLKPLNIADPDSPTIQYLHSLSQESPKLEPNEIVKMYDIDAQYKALRDYFPDLLFQIREELKNFCVFCVSKTPGLKNPKPDNLLMWSHYADEHKGAVIRFRCFPEINIGLCRKAVHVDYKPDIPPIVPLGKYVDEYLEISSIQEEDLARILTRTKSEVWKYEEEWRVVEAFGNEAQRTVGYVNLDLDHPKEIDQIVLGCRISKDNRDKITALIAKGYSHASVIQARKHPQKYALSFWPVRQGTDKATT